MPKKNKVELRKPDPVIQIPRIAAAAKNISDEIDREVKDAILGREDEPLPLGGVLERYNLLGGVKGPYYHYNDKQMNKEEYYTELYKEGKITKEEMILELL